MRDAWVLFVLWVYSEFDIAQPLFEGKLHVESSEQDSPNGPIPPAG